MTDRSDGADFPAKMRRLNAAAANADLTDAQRTAAYYLLDDLLATARQHGLHLADLDAADLDLPAACISMVRTKGATED